MVGKKSLRDNPIFYDLTEEEYDIVSGILKRKVYQPEETVFEEGGTDQILYIIKKGEVRICKEETHGDLQIITLLKDRDIYGDQFEAFSLEQFVARDLHGQITGEAAGILDKDCLRPVAPKVAEHFDKSLSLVDGIGT